MPVAEARSDRAWAVLGSLGLLLLVALFAYAPIFAVDFFWHLELGQIIASERAIPSSDLFSAVHPERPYVQFQWLWELVAYGAYRLSGLHGVRLLQVATLTGSYAMLLWSSRRLLPGRAVAFCFCALALVLFEDRFQTRPSATALGFVSSLLPLLVVPQLRDRRAAPYLTVAIACIWSNVHAGESLLMPLCFGALAAGAWLETRLADQPAARLRRDLLLWLCACLGVALSPALVSGLSDWTRLIGPQLASGNKEWRPSYTMLENGLTPSYLLIALGPTLVSIVYLLEQRNRVRELGDRALSGAPWSEWLLCGGLLVLAQQAVRNAFLCLVPLCFVLSRLPKTLPRTTQRLTAGLGAALLLVAFHDHVIEGYGGLERAVEVLPEELAPNAFPVELAQFMREAEIEGGVLNDGRWGGYLIWELWPRCHVFVDTRQNLTEEMWPIFLSSQRAHTRPDAMNAAFRRWGVELAVFRGPTFPVIVAPSDWKLVYKAGDQELYQHREGHHARQNLERTRAWLTRQKGVEVHEDQQARAAVEVGAERWLAAPHQRRVRARSAGLQQSAVAQDRVDGLALEGQLLFDAGLYQAALPLLHRVLRLHADETATLYRYALASYAVGDETGARRALLQLANRIAQLSDAQRGRLAVLERALSSR